jgi:hypothetical protein
MPPRCAAFQFVIFRLRQLGLLCAELKLSVIPYYVLQPAAAWLLEQGGTGVKVADSIAFRDHRLAPLIVPPQCHREHEGKQQAQDRYAGIDKFGSRIVAGLRFGTSPPPPPEAPAGERRRRNPDRDQPGVNLLDQAVHVSSKSLVTLPRSKAVIGCTSAACSAGLTISHPG